MSRYRWAVKVFNGFGSWHWYRGKRLLTYSHAKRVIEKQGRAEMVEVVDDGSS